MAAKPVTTVQDCVSPFVTETPLNFSFFFFFTKTLGQSPILFVVTREDIWMRSRDVSSCVSGNQRPKKPKPDLFPSGFCA